MNYEDIKKCLSIIINTLPTRGEYIVEVYGLLPDETLVDIEFELTECPTKEILFNTLDATLQELFDAKYNYHSDEEIDESDLLFDGGVHK